MLAVYLQLLETDEERLTFTKMYEYNHLKMYHAAFGILKNQHKSEDAVHSSFQRLAENYQKYSSKSPREMTSLCILMAKQHAINIIKKDKNLDFTDEYEEIAATEDIAVKTIIRKNEKDVLMKAISKLSVENQNVLILKYYHELSNKEISNFLGIPVKAVENRLYVSKQKLKRML